MKPLIRSEFLKVWTTRAWWVLGLVMFLYVGFTVAVLAFMFGLPTGDNAELVLGSTTPADVIVSCASSIGYVFPLIMGTLIVTAEYRTKTIIPTCLAHPARGAILDAKLAVSSVVGLIFGGIGILSTIGIGGVVLQVLRPGAFAGFDYLIIGRVVLVLALWAMIGVGLGALVHNQVAAIVIALVFTQFIEPMVRLAAVFVGWAGSVAQFLPGAASDNFVGSSVLTLSTSGAAATSGLVVPWWGGLAILAGYVIVLGLVGRFTFAKIPADVG